MSTLLAYNLTGAPLALAAGNSPVTLSASQNPPDRGPANNVTSELLGLSNPNYASLQAQVVAGDVVFEWDGEPDYETPGLSTILNATSEVSFRSIFRPGATGINAPGGVVYTDFALLMANADLTREDGLRIIEMDNRFSTDVEAVTGRRVCLIPAGDWDMTNIEIASHNAGSADGFFHQVLVEFQDDARFLHLLHINAQNMFWLGNNRNGSSIILDEAEAMWVTGFRNQFLNTVVGAQPLFEIGGPDFGAIGFNSGQNSLFGEVSLGGLSTGPIIDVPVGKSFFLIVNGATVADDTFSGGGDVFIFAEFSSSNAFGQMVQSIFTGNLFWEQGSGSRMMIQQATLVVDGDLLGQNLNRVDTGIYLSGTPTTFTESAGSVTMEDTTAAFADREIGQDIIIAGASSGGNDGTFAITARTDTTVTYVNGSGVTEAGAGTYDIEHGADITVTLPSAGPIYSERTVVLDVGGVASQVDKNIIIAVQAGERLNGVVDGTAVINTDFGTIELANEAGFVGDGVSWWIIGQANELARPDWSESLVVAANTVVLPGSGYVIAVDADTGTSAGPKQQVQNGAPAAGEVDVDYDAVGVATLTFNGTDAITAVHVVVLPRPAL